MQGVPGYSRLLGRGGLAALLIGAVAVVIVLARPIDAQAGSSCATRGHTLAANALARVYEDGLIYACYRRTGRTFTIYFGDTIGDPGIVRLAGTRVAFDYVDDTSRGSEDRSVIALRNVRTGRSRRIRVPEAATGATDMVLKPNGSLAEIRYVVLPSQFDPVLQVRRFDGRGKRLLATGADIGPRSLTLSGSTLRWRQGGNARRAFLR